MQGFTSCVYLKGSQILAIWQRLFMLVNQNQPITPAPVLPQAPSWNDYTVHILYPDTSVRLDKPIIDVTTSSTDLALATRPYPMLVNMDGKPRYPIKGHRVNTKLPGTTKILLTYLYNPIQNHMLRLEIMGRRRQYLRLCPAQHLPHHKAVAVLLPRFNLV